MIDFLSHLCVGSKEMPSIHNFLIARIRGHKTCADTKGICIVFGRHSKTESWVIVAENASAGSMRVMNNTNLENPSTLEQVNIIKNNEDNIITAIQYLLTITVEEITLEFPSFELYQGKLDRTVLIELQKQFKREVFWCTL